MATIADVHPNKRFCANHEPGLKCPKCGEEEVYVREHDKYYEAHEYEAFCDSCDASLFVEASVRVEFSQPKVYGDERDAPSGLEGGG